MPKQFYKAKIIDLSPDSMVFELTGKPDKIDAFLTMFKGYEILELCRTGVTALERGGKHQHIARKDKGDLPVIPVVGVDNGAGLSRIPGSQRLVERHARGAVDADLHDGEQPEKLGDRRDHPVPGGAVSADDQAGGDKAADDHAKLVDRRGHRTVKGFFQSVFIRRHTVPPPLLHFCEFLFPAGAGRLPCRGTRPRSARTQGWRMPSVSPAH